MPILFLKTHLDSLKKIKPIQGFKDKKGYFDSQNLKIKDWISKLKTLKNIPILFFKFFFVYFEDNLPIQDYIELLENKLNAATCSVQGFYLMFCFRFFFLIFVYHCCL